MKTSRFTVLWIILIGGALPFLLFFVFVSLPGNLLWVQKPFHSACETVGFVAAIFLALLLLMKIDENKENSRYIWIASGLIGMGILDGYHAGIETGNNWVWLHVLAVLSGGIFFSIACLPIRIITFKNFRIPPVFTAAAAVAAGTAALAFPEAMPIMMIDGHFTATASVLNVITGVLFFISAVMFLIRYVSTGEKEEAVFSIFCMLNGSSAILFSFGEAWHAEWWFWHFLRLTVYFVVLWYIFRTFQGFIERQRGEAEIRAREAKFRTLVDNIPQKVFLKDRDYRWIAINRKFADDLGLQPDEVIGKMDSDLFPPELAAKYHEDDVRIMETNQTDEFDEKYIQDGQETWVHTVKTPVIDERGDIIGVLGVFQDITEKVKGEEIMRRQEKELVTKNRIAQVFLNTPDEDLYSEVLKVLLDVTESKYGVFGYIDEDGSLMVPSMTRGVWWDQCNVPEKDIRFPCDAWGKGSWPRALKEKKTNFTNEISTIVPKGHIPINRHISIPIIFRDEAIGLIQVANREVDYNENDIALLEELGSQIAPSLMARLHRDREEKRRKSVEEEVRKIVEVLASASSEIMTATAQIATGTAETAAAISETTTTVEEVRQAAQLSSEKAKNVADKAQRVDQASQAGRKAVDETSVGMGQIREQMESIANTIVRLSEQAQSVGGIIASVTDIADQSNLLAVNAAIEAARAGEQGKGFAVVAQEIKILAEQSKQATAQVRNILGDVQRATSSAVMSIEQGSKAVDAGVNQAAQAGKAIGLLSESSSEAVQTATQIVASSQQQVVGMDQIGIAIRNLNQAGVDTVASMRQVETSAKNLNELGQKLKEMIEQFKG